MLALPVLTEKVIPLARIVPGPNPRRYFSAEALEELTNSIRSRGILQRIIVRPMASSDDFEIVAGERRYRAAVAAWGPDHEIVVNVGDYNDEQALLVSIEENEQRENPSETEQADGALRLLEMLNGDRGETARRLGWPRSKFDRRIALTKLLPTIKTALDERRIMLGHAELLAAVAPDKQEKALASIVDNDLSVARTRELLARLTHSLADAKFDRTECQTCPFNSASQRALFATCVDDGLCTNPTCFETKAQQFNMLEEARLKEEAERKKAVLLTARAAAALEADPKTARQDALAALKLAPSLAPAALIAAKSYFREDNVRKASSVLEQAWKQAPSSEIATTYLRARSGDSALDRLKRAERLEALKPNNIESLLAVARAALDTKDFSRARQKAEAAARMDARESVFLLLADIEEAETGDQGRIRHWLGQALRAPRDPAWVADGFVSETWLPVSPVSGRLDAFEWKAPFHQIAARIEDGTLAEDALQTLPPLPEKNVSEPPKPAAVPAIIDAEPVVKPVPQAMKPAPRPAEARPTPEPVAANSSRAPDPFNGRPPDDPGVKFAEADSGEKTRLRLF